MTNPDFDKEFNNIKLGIGYQNVIEFIEKLETLVETHIKENKDGCNCGTFLSDIEPNACPGILSYQVTKRFLEPISKNQIIFIFLTTIVRSLNKHRPEIESAKNTAKELMIDRNKLALKQADLYDEINSLKDELETSRIELGTIRNERDEYAARLAALGHDPLET